MQNQAITCPMCEEGQLIPNICMEQTIYQGKILTVAYESSTCSNCASEIVTPTQAHHNQARILDEYRKIKLEELLNRAIANQLQLFLPMMVEKILSGTTKRLE